ncbi:shikimate kinase [bacterium]|nr:shikimate kinase [bacterium]
MNMSAASITRVYLIGIMGAGKSTVGRILATTLDWQLVDTDLEIEALTGKSISTIFAEEGETGFRDYEEQIMMETAHKNRAVICCGGGVVTRQKNLNFLAHELVVWLDLSPAEALARIEHSGNRPLLKETEDAMSQLNNILIARREAYTKVAKIRINSGGFPPEIIASNILGELERVHV